jgi:hypothetical protein
MKVKVPALCLAAVLLGGCTLNGSVENLLSPPMLYEGQSEIYSALTESVGREITLQYPRSGAYRSAFITADIDNDEENEAIVFYSVKTETDSSGVLRINVLDTDSDGQWHSVYDLAGTGTGVDRVIISELGKSGRKSVIIGFTGASSADKSLKAYSYSDGIMTNTYSDSYSNAFITNLDKESGNELSIIHPNNEYTGKQAYYSLVLDDGESLYESSTVLLSPKTSEYASVATGYVGTDTPAVYIDGLSGGKLYTEIVYSISGVLRNPLYLSDSEGIKDTERQDGYICTDLDMDGVIEIPTLSYFPGYSQDSRDAFITTDWNIMDSFSIVKKYSSYYNSSMGYCFIIPSRWDGVVTVKRDDMTGDIVFYKYNIDLLNSTEELLRISAVTSYYADERIADGYTVINKRDDMYYLYKSPDNTSEPLVLTDTEITNNFKLM